MNRRSITFLGLLSLLALYAFGQAKLNNAKVNNWVMAIPPIIGTTNSGPQPLTFYPDTNVNVTATPTPGVITYSPLPYALTLTTNALINNPTKMIDGQIIIFQFTQDATGNRAVYWDTKFAFSTDLPASVVNAYGPANMKSFVTAVYNLAADKWYVIAYQDNF